MIRKLKLTIVAFSLSALVIALIAIWLYTSESGLRWLFNQVEAQLPEQISIDTLSGNLSAGVKIKRVTYRHQGTLWQVEDALIDCDWFALFYRRLSCDSLKIARLTSVGIQTTDLKNTQAGQISPSKKSDSYDFLSRPINGVLLDLENAFAMLPVSIYLSQLTIESLATNALISTELIRQHSLPSAFVIEAKRVRLKQQALKIHELSVSAKDYLLNSSINFAFGKGRTHRVKVAVKTPALDANMESYGNLNDANEFTVSANQPHKLNLTGKWGWHNQFQITDAKLQLNEAVLNAGHFPISLTGVEATAQLIWPELQLGSSLNLKALDFEEAKGQIKGQIRDVTQWQSESVLSAELNLNTNRPQLAQTISRLLETTIPENLNSQTSSSVPSNQLPITLALDSQVNRGLLTMNVKAKGDNFINAESVITGRINEMALSDLSSQGDVDLHLDLADETVKIPQLKVGWLLSQTDSHWQGSVTGKVINGKYRDWHASLVALNIDVNDDEGTANTDTDRWRAKVSVNDLVSNEFNSAIETINLEVDGNPGDHQVAGDINFGSTGQAKFNLTGQLINWAERSDAKPLGWNIGQLNATISPGSNNGLQNKNPQTALSESQQGKSFFPKIPLPDKSLSHKSMPDKPQPNILVNAQDIKLSEDVLSAKEICLKHNGSLCLSVKPVADKWSLDWAIDTFELDTLNRLFAQIDADFALKLSGNLSGTGKLEAPKDWSASTGFSANSPILLKAQMHSDSITFATGEWSNSLNQLTISGQMDKDGELNLDWESSASRIKLATYQDQPINKPEVSEDKGLVLLGNAAQVRLNLNNNRLNYQITHGPINMDTDGIQAKNAGVNEPLDQQLDLASLQMHGHVDQQGITSDLLVELPDEDYIQGSFITRGPWTSKHLVDGNINWQFTNWALLTRLIPNLDRVAASWRHDAKISGPIDNLTVNGVGDLKIEQVLIEELGINITDSSISLKSENRKIGIEGLLNNGNGQLAIVGHADFESEPEAQLRLSGEKILLIDTAEHSVVLSPDLELQLTNNNIRVDGQVVVDKANISISALPKTAVTVSDDEVRIAQAEKSSSAVDYELNIDLIANNNIAISGFGLKAKANGKLKARKKKNSGLMLDGELKISEGSFKAYQQSLTIEEGQFLFLGSPENPGVQFKAVRKIDDITVGIIGDGSLINPRLTLFSNPSYSEENILALLLTGRTIESLSQHEANSLVNAAIDLGISQANRIVSKISDAFGLKDIQISSKTRADSTQLSIGTKINEKLSLGYGTTIDSKNELNTGWVIEYHLTPNISIEALSGEEVSTSISYKKQFNPEAEKVEKKESH